VAARVGGKKATMGNARGQQAKLNYVCVCFIVDDIVTTAEYYRDVLGFAFERYWGEPPCFVMLQRDGVQFFLSSDGSKGLMRPNRVARPDFTWDAYVNCQNGGALYEEFKRKGAEITREPEVTFYEMQEFEVRDCNGYTICFGTDKSEGQGR
jgi:predicted enzyme related to lactoylglutathione lyase